MKVDRDVIAAAMAAHVAEMDALPPPEPIPVTDETARFCVISLGDWLTLCERAGVPFVPARKVGELNRVDCLRFEEPEYDARNEATLRQAQQAARPRHMLRFDCAAGVCTKLRADEGQHQWHPDTQHLQVDDPRAYDIFFAQPREAIPVWERPWIDAAIIGTHPVEYRSYVRRGRILGISNYYPQRPLPRNEAHLNAVRRYTQRLIEAAETPFLWHESHALPEFGAEFGLDGIHFTADFIVQQDGDVLFLEGGPPHELGAAPCCFKAGRISGTALRARYDYEKTHGKPQPVQPTNPAQRRTPA